MTRILIADGAPAAGQAELATFGAPSNSRIFEAALHLHAPDAACLTINVADGETLPAGESLGGFDGVIFTGSPLNVYDRVPGVTRQIDFARTVFAARVPVWGSCWGLQLATAALGGTVRKNPRGRELGIARRIVLTEAGRAHPLYADKPDGFDALCSHIDEVETLPPGAVVLARNGISAVQAMSVEGPEGDFLGVQYHPEHVFAVTAAIVEGRADRLVAEGLGRTTADLAALAADYRALDADPARRDLAWRYGLDAEVLDPLRRTTEIGNWLRSRVLGRRAERAAAA